MPDGKIQEIPGRRPTIFYNPEFQQNRKTGRTMRVLNTSIDISAPAEDVWATLVASPAIPEPIRKAVQERSLEKDLKVRMEASGRGATLTVRLLSVDRPRTIRWKGHLWFPGLFDGDHTFEIRDAPGGGVRLIQRELFGGLLLPFLSGMLTGTEKEFNRLNAAIKQQAEGKA